jgi:hypothetical protein
VKATGGDSVDLAKPSKSATSVTPTAQHIERKFLPCYLNAVRRMPVEAGDGMRRSPIHEYAVTGRTRNDQVH